MEIHLWWTGKTSFPYLIDGINDYTKRIKHFCKLTIVEFKSTKGLSDSKQIQFHEENEILKKLDSKDYIILLDENGKNFTSIGFASHLEMLQNSSTSRIVFIIGGAFGFSDHLKARANLKLSFSSFTLSHQLIRLFFLEQLYRAYTIINKLPYHNE